MHTDISLEVFPPKANAPLEPFLREVGQMVHKSPKYVSVTYGAQGSDATARTLRTLTALRSTFPTLPLAAHLTCVNATRQETAEVLTAYKGLGINRIVALRGDLKADSTLPGYQNAGELVAGIRGSGFAGPIAVAGYPETHPDAASPEADITHLKHKLAAGADEVITQFFFDNEVYFSFVERCRAAGISAPVTPGILPILSPKAAFSMAKACGTYVPERMARRFKLAEKRGVVRELGLSYAAGQCDTLRAGGEAHLHLYTLNNAQMVVDLGDALGIKQTSKWVMQPSNQTQASKQKSRNHGASAASARPAENTVTASERMATI